MITYEQYVLQRLELPEVLATQEVHGNGFLKIDLSETEQLHVWHDALPKQIVPTVVHDHIYSFESNVLHGTVINTIIEPRINREGGGSYYAAWGGKELILIDDVELWDLHVTSSEAHDKECAYQMTAGAFHMANAVDTTITHVKKIDEPGGRSIVMVHKDVRPDNSFDRKAVEIPSCVMQDVLEILKQCQTTYYM